MTRRKRIVIVVTLFAGLIITGPGTGFSQQGSEISKTPTGQKQPMERPPIRNRFLWQIGVEVIADLSTDQLTYTGTCPTVFPFKGRIYSNRAMTLHYRFIRSDDVRTVPVALKLEKNEKKEVNYSWELGDPSGSAEFNGWVFLQVILPTNMKTVSNVVNFKGTCTNREEKTVGARGSARPEDMPSPHGSQKVPGFPYTGSVLPLPEGKGPASAGLSLTPEGQRGQPVTGSSVPPIPSSQGGPGPGGMPAPQPVPQGKGPGGMPVFQPGQPGPGDMPMFQSGEKGPMPGNTPMPLRNEQGPAVVMREDCISFNPDTATMEQTSFGWRVVDGNQTIFGFDFDKTEAIIALATIKHYKMTQSCFVGRPRPSFHYMLTEGSSPVGPFRPADCSPFDPITTNVEQINGNWRVADGVKKLFDFGEKKDEANQTLSIIKKYGFSHSCMIAKGKVEYTYMHK
jgi:hypothetical protein